MNTLIATPTAESPFDSPAVRDKTPAFVQQFELLVREQIVPAFTRYRDFLQREYLPAARDAIAVSANPGWRRLLRRIGALPQLAAGRRPNDVHATGLREVERLDAEMKAIGQRSFANGDVPALLQRARTEQAVSVQEPRGTDCASRRRRWPGPRRRSTTGSACCRKPTS